ncbi:MAG: phage terminase large subunit family protein [Candidatus Margulisiibacteriota bacterium]
MDLANLQKITSDVREFFRPPENLKPSEWAERNIYIPVGNALPGLIRFDNAPYQREPLDMLANPECRKITLMWAAQTGKTNVVNCGIGFFVAKTPQSQIVMFPTQGDMSTWLETKLNAFVSASQVLQERIAKPRGRQGVNNQRMKSYPGGFLMFSWSGSPNTMRGRSAPKIYCDEVDGYEVTPEGDPINLLWQRAATFGDNRLLLATSTPTVKDISRIEKSFDEGDKRRYWLPCPFCGEYQHLKWAQVKWDKDEQGEHLPETARYECEFCRGEIKDGHKLAMLRSGKWQGEKPFRGHASYHLNELYSPFRRFRDIVGSFLEKKQSNDLQTFVNVSLAETWEEQGEKVDSTGLMKRVESYSASVPKGGLILTAGVDMQTDRLEVELVAWGFGEESWSIDYKVLWGDPLHGDVWEDLDDYLATTWRHESGNELPISAACLDTGGTSGYTQAAYDYVKRKSGRRVFAIKGVGGWGRPIVAAPSRKRSGPKQRKVDLFAVGTDEAKLVIARRLGITDPGPGYCHFPDSRDPEWFHQLTAERLITRYSKGFPIREWHKTRPRNEALDARVYALAALKIMSPNYQKLAERVASPLKETISKDKQQIQAKTPAKDQSKKSLNRQRRTGGWLKSW